MKFPIGLVMVILITGVFAWWFFGFAKANGLSDWVYFAVVCPVGFFAGWVGGDIDHG